MVPLHQMVHGGHGLLVCPKVWCYLALLTDLELLDHPGQHGSLSNLSSSSDHVVEVPKAFSGGPGCSCSDGKHHRIRPQHYTTNWKQQVWTIEFHQFIYTISEKCVWNWGRDSSAGRSRCTPAATATTKHSTKKMDGSIKKMNPTLVNYFVIISGLTSGSICGIYLLTLYSGILSDILFWHSIWHLFWHPIWHPFWHPFWDFLWYSFWPSIWHSIWHSLQAFYLTYLLTFSANFISHIFRRSFWCSFWCSIWHSFWHSFWHSIWHCILAVYLASILTFSLACVEVRQCPLRSAARPAAPTEIWSSRLRSGSAHWVLELAVGAQQCPLRSGARSWGRRRKEQEGGKQLW